MTALLPLYDDGEAYDQIFPGTDDIPYWQAQIAKANGESLELACGTGRVLLELRAQGLNVEGLDASTGMLSYAAEKAKQRGLQVKLYQGDMRHFQLDKTFASIYIPANTLGHLYTRDDIEAHLASVKRHLQPQGVYMFDMFVPNPQFLTDSWGQRHAMGEYINPSDGALIKMFQQGQYNHATQVTHETWSYERDGQILREEAFSIRIFFPQELDALLEYNGFEIIAKYGNYDFSLFDSQSKHQLIEARIRS